MERKAIEKCKNMSKSFRHKTTKSDKSKWNLAKCNVDRDVKRDGSI